MATLGIFAFLGRETRLFLSEMNIKDLDDQTKDFLRSISQTYILIQIQLNKNSLKVFHILQLLGVWLPVYLS